jgi:hypothetical protein
VLSLPLAVSSPPSVFIVVASLPLIHALRRLRHSCRLRTSLSFICALRRLWHHHRFIFIVASLPLIHALGRLRHSCHLTTSLSFIFQSLTSCVGLYRRHVPVLCQYSSLANRLRNLVFVSRSSAVTLGPCLAHFRKPLLGSSFLFASATDSSCQLKKSSF